MEVQINNLNLHDCGGFGSTSRQVLQIFDKNIRIQRKQPNNRRMILYWVTIIWYRICHSATATPPAHNNVEVCFWMASTKETI